MSDQQYDYPDLYAGPFRIFAAETAERWFIARSLKTSTLWLIGLTCAEFRKLERELDLNFKEGFVPSADMSSSYYQKALLLFHQSEPTREQVLELAGVLLAHCRWLIAGGASVDLDGLTPEIGVPGYGQSLTLAIKPGEIVLADILSRAGMYGENDHVVRKLLTEGIRFQKERCSQSGDYGVQELAVLVRERDGKAQAELSIPYGRLIETATQFPALIAADTKRDSLEGLLEQMLGHAFCGFVEARDQAPALLENSRQRLQGAVSMLLCHLDAMTWARSHPSCRPYEIELWQAAGKWSRQRDKRIED
ncbi:hypothetical protein [Mesorhizobium sp. A623]